MTYLAAPVLFKSNPRTISIIQAGIRSIVRAYETDEPKRMVAAARERAGFSPVAELGFLERAAEYREAASIPRLLVLVAERETGGAEPSGSR